MARTTIHRCPAGGGRDSIVVLRDDGGQPAEVFLTPSLSARLRQQTAPAHALIEARLGLPAAIRTAAEYAELLVRFLGIYRPLERELAEFPDWDESGIALPVPGHAECLTADLACLFAVPRIVPLIPRRLLPDLPAFPHAIGALYVLEGATLGGRPILRDLETRMGSAIAGATCFFGGRGDLTVPRWRAFRAAVDDYGRARPWHGAAVVLGAQRTFQAILAWFPPSHDLDRQS